MHVKKISLINFRNYRNVEVLFDPFLNIFLGDNAQGKTNLLESIFYLSGGSSNRTSQDRELVKWEKDSFTISALFETRKGNYHLQVLKSLDGNKEIKLNGIQQKGLPQELKAIIFSPEDLNLVKGSPSLRRNFIDREISQIYSVYRYNLQNYNKILRQRNKLLKLSKDRNKLISDLEAWDNQLVEYGSLLILKRLEVVKKLAILSRLIYRRLTDHKENLEVCYYSNLNDLNINIDKKFSIEEIKDAYFKALLEKREEEIRYRATLPGPHRDDLVISIDNKQARNFASQGQQRTSILALKLSIIELIKSQYGEYPILLLDDVFSELDRKRRDFLIKEIKSSVQTFITSTREYSIKDEIAYPAKNFLIEEGECRPISYEKNNGSSGEYY